MKQKSTSQSAFFNLRVLIGLFVVLTGVFLAVIGFGTFSGLTASSAKAQQTHKIINVPGLPPGFDCATIHERGIDRMENLGAGLIMIACGEATGGSATSFGAFSQLLNTVTAPLAYGGADVDLINPQTDAGTHITQSETFSGTNPDNPNQIVVAYNDSRDAVASPFDISAVSVSNDGGTTFTRVTNASGHSPFGNTVGDPVALYNKPTGTWFTIWIDEGCGGFGIGGYKSTNPSDPTSWTHFCVHNGSGDDRESGWADNNTSSPHFGNMYVSRNDFNVGGGALFVSVSTNNGLNWTQHQLTNSFVRDVQITGDSATGDVYVAAMNEGGGGTAGPRSNLIFRSTDGGTTWTNTFTSANFTGPSDGSLCSTNTYFASMFSGYWRHMGWGEPAALNSVVHYVYAQHGVGSDPGDIFYIRSTDKGVTFSAPLKLNTDTTSRPQWQPNISVSSSGTVFAMWYDARGSTSCVKGSPTVLCYQMWGRKSTDNGATWLADMAFSDAMTPLPGQPDSSIVGCYAGDYDYGSALTGFHNSAWVDGRGPIISNQSQQDTFFDKEPAGTTGIPCSDLVSFQVRCIAGAHGDKLQAKLTLTNTSHSGEQVTITVDGTPNVVTINGSKASLQIANPGVGPHTVELTNPAGCFPPSTPNCP